MHTYISSSSNQEVFEIPEDLASSLTSSYERKRVIYREVLRVDEKISYNSHEPLCTAIASSIAEVPEITAFYDTLDDESREHFIHRTLRDQIKHFDTMNNVMKEVTDPVSADSTFTEPGQEFVKIVDALDASINTSSGDLKKFMADPYALYTYRLVLDESKVIAAAKAWTEARAEGSNFMFYKIAENWDDVKHMPIDWGLHFLELKN